MKEGSRTRDSRARGRDPAAGLTMVEMMVVIAIIAVVAIIAIPNLLSAKLASNETGAIATMRTIATAQAQVQGIAAIDADYDAIGEFGTFSELSGAGGVRRRFIEPRGRRNEGSNFGEQGPPLDPALLPPEFQEISDIGYATKSGYVYKIFLPCTKPRSRWVHEIVVERTRGKGKKKRTVVKIRLQNDTGGTRQININLAESLWCAYAQPVTLGSSGNRAFFTNQRGDVLHSDNTVAQHQGQEEVMDASSAYLGVGITSKVAVGTAGNDGDVWKITN